MFVFNKERELRMETTVQTSGHAATAADDYYSHADQSFGECRQRLISYLVKLNQALNDDMPDLADALLSRFCDSLVDYLSAGHFRVFQRMSLPADAYAVIDATTQAGVAFNDRFDELRQAGPAQVRTALEQIARVLSARFEIEDELLYAEVR